MTPTLIASADSVGFSRGSHLPNRGWCRLAASPTSVGPHQAVPNQTPLTLLLLIPTRGSSSSALSSRPKPRREVCPEFVVFPRFPPRVEAVDVGVATFACDSPDSQSRGSGFGGPTSPVSPPGLPFRTRLSACSVLLGCRPLCALGVVVASRLTTSPGLSPSRG